MRTVRSVGCLCVVLSVAGMAGLSGQDQPLPSTPLHYRSFVATFAADGAFALAGPGRAAT